MRVLHVIDSLRLGGVEVLLTEMIPRFARHGVESSVAVLKPTDSPLKQRLQSLGVPFVPNLYTRIYSPLQVRPLTRCLPDYDLAQSYLFPSQLWLAMAAARCGKPVPIVTTEQSTVSRRRKWWYRPVDRWMYRRYSAIACNSQGSADALLRWLPEVADRVSVVFNGVPLERFQQAQAPPRGEVLPDDGAPVLIFVARMQYEKDHDTVLRALAQVPRARLLLVGDGERRPSLQELARSLGVAERVHFLGRRPDVDRLLKLAALYVHSSHYEGFGIAAVEAMAAGLPIIASDVPGLSEVVGSAGLLFPQGDAGALARHLNAVLASDDLRQKLARASQQRAQEFSIERTVQSYLDIYRKVTAAAGRTS